MKTKSICCIHLQINAKACLSGTCGQSSVGVLQPQPLPPPPQQGQPQLICQQVRPPCNFDALPKSYGCTKSVIPALPAPVTPIGQPQVIQGGQQLTISSSAAASGQPQLVLSPQLTTGPNGQQQLILHPQGFQTPEQRQQNSKQQQNSCGCNKPTKCIVPLEVSPWLANILVKWQCKANCGRASGCGDTCPQL